MAYREPAVRVTQEFTNALPALAAFALPHVNVGPVFQVVKQKEAGPYAGLATNLSYPEQMAGTYVDVRPHDPKDLVGFPVRIYLKDTIVTLVSGTGAVVTSGGTEITNAAAGAFANVRAGDVVVITGSTSGNNGSFTVREKLSANSLKMNEQFPAAETGLAYSVRRNVQADLGMIEIARSTSGVVIEDTQVTLPAGLTVAAGTLGSLSVVSAKVVLSYRALRIDKSADVWSYSRLSELQADFGLDQIVPENPAVFAAYISLQTATVQTNILALNATYMTDELMAYQLAMDVLKMTDIYAISVMSHSPSVHMALKAHCEGMSLPTNRMERVGIVSRPVVTSATVVAEVTTGAAQGIAGAGNLTLTSSQSQFITDGVVPGHFVKVKAPANVAGRYQIAAVVSQTQLTLKDAAPTSASAITFEIEKNLQKGEQAAVMAAYASSLGSRRMVFVWPDVVRGPVGSEIRDLPGYFLAPVVGALTTGLPTQQGLTNLGVGYFTGVRHSTKYFDRDQLNVLAGGGVMIFVQDVLDTTALYVRHQLTTDTSAIKFQEFSITKNVDFIAKFIRENHKQFIGQYNVVDSAFDDLKSNAAGLLKFLKDNTRLPKIGGVIRGGKLTTLKQDDVNIDTIIERYQIDIPAPLNNLDITIVV